MTPYGNLDGTAGVVGYEFGDDSITIEFRGGAAYVYDYDRPGREHVERMKELAGSGRGLSTHISQNVRSNYARRLR